MRHRRPRHLIWVSAILVTTACKGNRYEPRPSCGWSRDAIDTELVYLVSGREYRTPSGAKATDDPETALAMLPPPEAQSRAPQLLLSSGVFDTTGFVLTSDHSGLTILGCHHQDEGTTLRHATAAGRRAHEVENAVITIGDPEYDREKEKVVGVVIEDITIEGGSSGIVVTHAGTEDLPIRLESVSLASQETSGISIVGGDAHVHIRGVSITDVIGSADHNGDLGHGLSATKNDDEVAAPPRVTLRDLTVERTAGAGVVLEDAVIDAQIVTVCDANGPGVVVQGNTTGKLSAVTVEEAGDIGFGVVATVNGAPTIEVAGLTVSNVTAQAKGLGDGVSWVGPGASGVISGLLKIEVVARKELLIDSAAVALDTDLAPTLSTITVQNGGTADVGALGIPIDELDDPLQVLGPIITDVSSITQTVVME